MSKSILAYNVTVHNALEILADYSSICDVYLVNSGCGIAPTFIPVPSSVDRDTRFSDKALKKAYKDWEAEIRAKAKDRWDANMKVTLEERTVFERCAIVVTL